MILPLIALRQSTSAALIQDIPRPSEERCGMIRWVCIRRSVNAVYLLSMLGIVKCQGLSPGLLGFWFQFQEIQTDMLCRQKWVISHCEVE